jgi:hypothetical protein
VARPSALPPLDCLFAAAEQHDVAGLLAATLLGNWRGELPDEVCEGLAIYREGLRLDALRAEAQLAELLHLLAERGLPALPFKGPLLARNAYAEPTLRPCLDLDLMVHPDDVPHVLACLLEAGFRHQDGLGADGIMELRRYAGEYILFRPKSLPVEPHWHPAPWTMAFNIDIDALWRRARPATFLGALATCRPRRITCSCSPCMARRSSGTSSNGWSFVAALLASHPGLDLAALRATASPQGCGLMLDLALLLTHRLFAIPTAVPSTDRVVTRLANRVLERLDRTAEAPPGPYVVSSFHWRLRERRRDGLSYATRTLFTPRVAHYRRLPLPPALRWLHVPLKLPWDYVLTPAIGLARRMSRPAP